MKRIVLPLLVLLIFNFSYSQNKQLIGKYLIDTSTITQQQVGSANPPPNIIIIEQLLLVGNDYYKLYQISKQNDLLHTSGKQQQRGIEANYFIKGFKEEVGKYCQFAGIIDTVNKIIYEAKLVKVFSEVEISEILNKTNKASQ